MNIKYLFQKKLVYRLTAFAPVFANASTRGESDGGRTTSF